MQLGRTLPRPRAIITVSAHWESVAPLVTGDPEPGIIHDFGGPASLRRLTYDLKGAPGLAEETIAMLTRHGTTARCQSRAFDHGTCLLYTSDAADELT